MNTVFADTFYWIARFNRRDQWAEAARIAKEQAGSSRVVTTEEVLVEFLNDVRSGGPKLRAKAIRFVRNLFLEPELEIIRQSHASFDDGLELYAARADKAYSLTDCISMAAMRERNIRAALTAGRHFSQEGFTALMKPAS